MPELPSNKMLTLPQFILAHNKTFEEIIARINTALKTNSRILITKVSNSIAVYIRKKIPKSVYYSKARIITIGNPFKKKLNQNIVIISAGNSDEQVAEEAAAILTFLGYQVVRLYNFGVSKIEKLMSVKKQLGRASVVITVAGMEASLATVVAGMVTCPVIAVPTSVGYGASFGGLTAFLAMVNSCVPGVSVVNIDNGFGAAIAVHRIMQTF